MIRAILLSLPLLAASVFDTDMSDQDKKSTGMNKLTEKEKAALQQWIETHFHRETSQPAAKSLKGVNPTLSENLMNSQYLRLSDGTLWNVRTEDVPIAQSWITPVEIEVGKSNNPFYPYKLTNKVSGTSILVRKADKLPQPGSPPLSPKDQPKTF